METTSLLSVRVADRRREAQDIISLELVDPQGRTLPEFSPGAHIDVYVPGGLIRQYSLLNDCTERSHFVIGVLREADSRGGSVALHERVQVGDLLQVSTPRNRFCLAADATRSLLFAGGIGVTPILCMAQRLRAQAADFELYYSCRTHERAAYLDRLGVPGMTEHVHLHFDDEQPAHHFDVDAALAGARAGTHIYVCGPAGYIDFVCAHARAAGLDEAHIHFEHFALAEEDSPSTPVEGDFAFQVQLASTGEIFDIPADETITNALDRQGVFIPVSCEEGICGTCLTGIKSGIPDHRDSYLTDEEHAANDQFTPCCSRSKTPLLILDL